MLKNLAKIPLRAVSYSSDPNFINGLGYFGQVESVSDVAQYQNTPFLNNELDSPFYTDMKFTNLEWGEEPTVAEEFGLNNVDWSMYLGMTGSIQITGFTKHALAQVIGIDGVASVKDAAVIEAVKTPIEVIYQEANDTIKYIGENAVVVLNKAGKVVTAWAKNIFGTR